jgi:recombination protein RecA
LSLSPALDAVLPDGGLPWGQVTELCVAQPSYATSISLLACARAQAEGLEAIGSLEGRRGGEMPWCAFVDPFGSLYAPGVAQAGVNLERLLVVRPSIQALSRIVVRLVEARAFALIVVDTFSPVARPIAKGVMQVDLTKWVNVVRRLNTAVANTHSAVLLLTDKNAPRPLPLPVALRLELSCTAPGEIKAKVAKEKHGRVTLTHTISGRDLVPTAGGS